MFSCLEHVEEIMDRYIDEKEVIPVLFKLEENETHKCELCNELAVYSIGEGADIQEHINDGEV